MAAVTRTRLLSLLLLVLTLLGVVGALAPAAQADVVPPPAARPWFGPQLDWSDDLPADYSGRLGTTPSTYAQTVDYPLTDDSTLFLQQFAEQAATEGTVATLTLEPTVALEDLGTDDAAELGAQLDTLHDQYDSTFLVRFAPEMNGSWQTWGQQPTAYVAAFRAVADAVHDATDDAAMVWAPSYGAGYPFRDSARAVDQIGTVEAAELDTSGDGDVTSADDPYGPYFPGDEYVDWVGLSVYSFGDDSGSARANRVAPAGDYEGRLDEAVGYGDDIERDSFYDRFAVPQDRPMLVDTGALFVPGAGGASAQQVKQGWWRQVLAAAPDHPLIRGITWLEVERREDEAGGDLVDWRATATDGLASALAADLREAGVDLRATTRILDQQTANEAAVQARYVGDAAPGDEMGWIVASAVVLALLYLVAGAVGRWVPSWRYPDEHDPRDRRLDLLRGIIILTVVFTHIELFSPYSFLSLKVIGAITGAEMFVLLSGVVLGMIYGPTVRKRGESATGKLMLLRARKQYVVSLVVVVLVYLLGRIPFVSSDAITTFTDRGTGEDGTATAGQVYNLYANGDRLLDYPPPWYAVKQLLLLEMGPWVFNIMGLFVVLSLLLPFLMYLVLRGRWWLLLAVSWALYVWGSLDDPHLLPSQFEAVFPLFIWQVVFTHGLVLGHYRQQITRALVSRVGKVVVTLLVVGYAGVLGYLWLTTHYGTTPVLLPADSYQWLYENAYVRVVLQPGRLLDLAFVIVVAFAVLTTCWKPIDKVAGWLWIPLGQASLYVFIVHVFFALAVANIPGLDRGSLWQGTLLHTGVALAIWWMVKHQVLFKVIPR